jgi:hypothetical protein
MSTHNLYNWTHHGWRITFLHQNKTTASYLLHIAAIGNGLNWLHIEALVIVLIQLLEHIRAPKVFVLHVIVNR